MTVSFGVSLGTNPVLLRREERQKFTNLVKMLDDYGVTAIGTYDLAFIGGDNYVRSTLIALATERARVGPRPTNPLTREPQQTYIDGYELYDHVLDSGRNPKRMQEFGLTQYAIDRFALAGAPNDWVARIEEIADAGATRLWIGTNYGDLDRQMHDMRIFGEQILPHFT